MTAPKEGDLQIWWVPQVPMPAFNVPVADHFEAKKLLSILADYDKFQLDHSVKGDYANAGGLSVFEDGEWMDWHHPETDEDIGEWTPPEV